VPVDNFLESGSGRKAGNAAENMEKDGHSGSFCSKSRDL
jgi:hypothetical protein